MNHGSQPLKGIVFDMDGVLVDSEPLYFQAESALAEEYGKTFPPALVELLAGQGGKKAMAIFARELGLTEDPGELQKRRDEIFVSLLKGNLTEIRGASSVLGALKDRGLSMAVASAACRELVELELQSLNLWSCFQVVLSGDDIVNNKPDPEIFKTAIAKLGLKPNQVAVVEDSVNGLRAAKASGALAIGLCTTLPKATLLPEADLVVDSLDDVLPLCDRTFS